MVKKGVIFDLDGTLVDSYEAIAASLNAARAHFGFEAQPVPEVRRHVGWGLEVLMERSLGAERVLEGVRVFRERYREIFIALTRLMPGARETVATLAGRGYRLGVATNKPEVFSRQLIDELGLGRFIAVVRGAKDGVRLKPEPDLVLAVLSELGLAPAEAVYVGDMGVDIATARAAGLDVLLVATGSQTAAELEAAGAPHVMLTLAELAAILA